MAYKTIRPTGLSVKRHNNYFTISWKITDKDYGEGQTLQYRFPKGKWKNVVIGSATTKKTLMFPATDYYPYKKKTLGKLFVRVRGRRKDFKRDTNSSTTINPEMSDWTQKDYDVLIPMRPSLSAALSSSANNVTTFTWKTVSDAESARWFSRVQCQTRLVQDSTIVDGSKLSATGWTHHAYGAANGSASITEDSSVINRGVSYTRWFRVRSQGPQGHSEWVYARHVYAVPYQTKDVKATAKQTEAGGYLCTATWKTPKNSAHPVDKINIQYCYAQPVDGMQCPDGISWTDAETLAYKDGSDASSISIDSTVGTDQCMFVRINTVHDRNTTYGYPVIAAVGALAAPTGLTIDNIDTSTYRVTVIATNTSQVQDSFLAIKYMTADDPNGFIIGIIPHGQTTITVQCPAFTSSNALRFGAMAVVGSYTETVRGDSVSSYAIKTQMRSALVEYGGSVPAAPGNVALAQTGTVGTVRVTFDWAWQQATVAELSWADHDDAWESTDGPTTYMINNTHASAWNISGLQTGKTWYIRVRLASGVGENQTFGAYSDIVSIDLSSAPAIPILTLSDSVITEDGSVTASWAFSSTDGSAQASAEVAEVDNGTYTTLAVVESIQHVTISAEDAGWTSGETHSLVVRVVSESGRQSAGWSDPVSVTVAEPITAEITDTSLVHEVIEENAREYSGDMISYDSDIDGAPVTSLTVNIEPVQSGSGDPSPDNIRPITGWDAVKVYRSGENTEEATEYDISLASAGTVYGGTLDVVSGRLTVDRKSILVDGTQDIRESQAQRFFVGIADAREITLENQNTDASVICECFKSYTWEGLRKAIGCAPVYGFGVAFRNPAITTVSAWKEYFQNNPTRFVYTLANPITYNLTPTEVKSLLGINNIWSDAGSLDIRVADDAREVMSLKEMPLSVTVEGAGLGGTTRVVIERAETYHMARPDETNYNGFEGETIAIYTQTGEDQISIGLEDLIGHLDDGAAYRLIATVQDGLGQSAEVVQGFEVHWTHQALMPDAYVYVSQSEAVAVLRPIAPEGALGTDVCDIYRLSVDKPELIYPDAVFGETYVDPYPTIGEHGGHRFVFRTANGDYITENDELAWVDMTEPEGDTLRSDSNIIDFAEGRVAFEYNTDLSTSWKKDFTETRYLGGSVQGDWNPAVSRTGTIAAVTVTDDQETIRALRRLATHHGICHVRTKDGSSYAADVQVSESHKQSNGHRIVEFSLSITRVDAEGYDGLTLAEWQQAGGIYD